MPQSDRRRRGYPGTLCVCIKRLKLVKSHWDHQNGHAMFTNDWLIYDNITESYYKIKLVQVLIHH